MIIKFESNCILLNEMPIPPSGNDYINRRYPTKKKKEFMKKWNDEILSIKNQKHLSLIHI